MSVCEHSNIIMINFMLTNSIVNNIHIATITLISMHENENNIFITILL